MEIFNEHEFRDGKVQVVSQEITVKNRVKVCRIKMYKNNIDDIYRITFDVDGQILSEHCPEGYEKAQKFWTSYLAKWGQFVGL